MTVSGLTTMSAERQPDHSCSSHAHKKRSNAVSRTRTRCDLRSTLIWWRRARISNCKAARVRKNQPRVVSRTAPTSIDSIWRDFCQPQEVYRAEYRDLAHARVSIGEFLEKVYNQ